MSKNITGKKFANLIHSYGALGEIAADENDLLSKRYVFDRYSEAGVEVPLVRESTKDSEIISAGSMVLSGLEIGYSEWDQDALNTAVENLKKVVEGDKYLAREDKALILANLESFYTEDAELVH